MYTYLKVLAGETLRQEMEQLLVDLLQLSRHAKIDCPARRHGASKSTREAHKTRKHTGGSTVNFHHKHSKSTSTSRISSVFSKQIHTSAASATTRKKLFDTRRKKHHHHDNRSTVHGRHEREVK